MKYVAFLRGINVGGNNIIKMNDLRLEFETLGFDSVSTYIQSGNVIFESEEENARKLESLIEVRLCSCFKYRSRVMVRSQKDMEKIIMKFPEIFKNNKWKHNVIFLGVKIDSKEILKSIELKKDIEEATYAPGVLYWSAQIATIGRSNMLKLSRKKELYQEMTVRNVNTSTKIFDKMN